jgi:hypothetical protein
MLRCSFCVASIGLTLAAGSAMGQYTFGGVGGGQSWNWENAGMGAFRSAVTSPTNFGPGGIVNAATATTTLGGVSAGSLAGIDCFVSPAMADGQFSAANVNDIVSFFLSGGDLLLLNDNASYDQLGEALGLPTSINVGSATAIGSGAPLMSGPFGTITSFNQWYLVGAMNPADVAGKNGHVAATNAGGVAAAYWNAGEYAPGAGKLVIITDVDTLAGSDLGYPGGANYGAMNSNAQFALNVANFFVVPTPGAGGVLVVAGLLAGRRRR